MKKGQVYQKSSKVRPSALKVFASLIIGCSSQLFEQKKAYR